MNGFNQVFVFPGFSFTATSGSRFFYFDASKIALTVTLKQRQTLVLCSQAGTSAKYCLIYSSKLNVSLASISA